MNRLIIISNRVPSPRASQPQAGGLAVALRGALEEHGGLWFGWDGQLTDQPSTRARVVRKGDIEYATIPLTETDHEEYYLGYSNEVLWPVFHFQLGAMGYQKRFLLAYKRVNALFAEALRPLLQGGELLWVHDYHLIPLGRELRSRGADQRLGFFLHTPLPSYDLIRALPGFRELLRDLCDYDLVGFQTRNDLRAFMDSVVQALGGEAYGEDALRVGDRVVRVGVYPVGVDTEEVASLAERALHAARVQRLFHGLGDRDVIIGADRLDYSKGLPNRFRGFATLMHDYPHRRGNTVFIQIASPSRTSIREYGDLRRKLEGLCGHINGTYADLDWVPMHYINRTFARPSLMGLYRAASVGLVTPLRDGMNLVAKEFVASQNPENPGVLVLSELAGASRELGGALPINPYDVDSIAAGLNEALAMPLAERRRRYESMMDILRRNSIFQWRRRFINDLQATATG